MHPFKRKLIVVFVIAMVGGVFLGLLSLRISSKKLQGMSVNPSRVVECSDLGTINVQVNAAGKKAFFMDWEILEKTEEVANYRIDFFREGSFNSFRSFGTKDSNVSGGFIPMDPEGTSRDIKPGIRYQFFIQPRTIMGKLMSRRGCNGFGYFSVFDEDAKIEVSKDSVPVVSKPSSVPTTENTSSSRVVVNNSEDEEKINPSPLLNKDSNTLSSAPEKDNLPFDCATTEDQVIETTSGNTTGLARVKINWDAFAPNRVTPSLNRPVVYLVNLEEQALEDGPFKNKFQNRETNTNSLYLGGLISGNYYKYTVKVKGAPIYTCNATFKAIRSLRAENTVLIDELESVVGNVASGDLNKNGILDDGEQHLNALGGNPLVTIEGGDENLISLSVPSKVVVSMDGSLSAPDAEVRTITSIGGLTNGGARILSFDRPFSRGHVRASASLLKKEYPKGTTTFSIENVENITVGDELKVGDNTCRVTRVVENSITCAPAFKSAVEVGAVVTETGK